MQINLNSAIYKTTTSYPVSGPQSTNASRPEYTPNRAIAFAGADVVQKTVSSKIALEKNKILSHLKNILSNDIPILSEEEKVFALIKRAHSLMRMKERRIGAIRKEMEFLNETNSLNPQQKINRAAQLMKEFNRLEKMKLTEPVETKSSSDNYDYALINKFKNAVMNDDYNFEDIYNEHYNSMKDIKTVEEFREKYPSIRIPTDPKEVLVKKIMETFDREYYTDFNELFDTGNENLVANAMEIQLNNLFTQIAPMCGKSVEELFHMIGIKLAKAILDVFEGLKITDNFDAIPEKTKSKLPAITPADKEMLNLDYDALVLNTLKQHYLEGKKLNKIEYTEGDKKISITSIKSPEYRFEKQPEKIRNLINDARKTAALQRDYQNFTQNELKSRLDYYVKTKLGNNEDIFNIIVDFDSCKFTEEDRQYLIKFLELLDKIKDKKLTLEEGIETIQKNNIRPHGTIKLDAIERKALEEKIKLEQEKNIELNKLREEFDNTINSLYRFNLASLIPSFSNSYPETFDETAMQEAKNVIKMIKDSIALENPTGIKNSLMRREAFREYSQNDNYSEVFKQALKYAGNFSGEEKELKCGQYILNRELVDSYPDSLPLAQNKKILQKIMDFSGSDKNLATEYLCKYENYNSLDKEERQSILNILKIFDSKNYNDRILIKHIVENDYIKTDTTLSNTGNTHTLKATITPKAKKAILDKYKFPGCLDLFELFEEALTNTAAESGMSGIKKISTKNNALDYKMELKIMGYPDRLFSSQNDYRFDIYSDKGLH